MAKAKSKPTLKTKAKTKAKSVTAKPVGAFPFFGAGDAGYFEWFEMWVWFAKPVPKASRAALAKLAPKIGQVEWPHEYLLWASAGDIQGQLVEAYGTAKAKKRMSDYRKKLDEDEDADPWGGDSDELLAMGDESKRFNQDLEAWLVEVHALHPILFAARREDHEAGGTKLSAWHKKSLAQFADVEAKVHVALAAKPLTADDNRRTALSIAAHFAGDDNISAATRAAIAEPSE
jgi:hypothetical protein